jgi:tol-pal system protein YbgF
MRLTSSSSAALLTLLLGVLSGCALLEPTGEAPETSQAQETDARITRLERQSQASLELQRQIEALQAEVRSLRGALDEAQHQDERGKAEQRDLYADIDRRLQALEARAQAPAVAGVPAVADREAYQRALAQLKSRDYAGAVVALTAFPTRYPDSPLLDNAKYWLGEAHYVEKRYAAALEAFDRVLTEHPQSRKVPDALLKAGYCEYELKHFPAARAYLERLVKQYPEAPAAADARARLAKMSAEKR